MPGSLTFASQIIGTTSAPQSIALTNNGAGTLTISGMTVTGANAADFKETNTCGASVASGASCSINVTFTPLAAGARAAAISVADNASGSPQSIPLSGTSAAADFVFSLPTGSATIAAGAPAIFTINASGQGSFTGSVSLAATGLPPFSTASFNPPSLSPGAGSASSTLTITTTARTQATALLTLPSQRPPWFPFTFFALGTALLSLMANRKRRMRLARPFAFALLLGLTAFVSSCGGGGVAKASGTPAGTYVVTITGTSGATQHSTTITLIVQ